MMKRETRQRRPLDVLSECFDNNGTTINTQIITADVTGRIEGCYGEGGAGSGAAIMERSIITVNYRKGQGMRVIIEVQSYVLVDAPDADAADDVGCELCSEVEMAVHDTPEDGGARHAHIDTRFRVCGDEECGWLDSEDCRRANDLLKNKWRKRK